MTIQELARRAGVTRRTIRYYVAEGLLPPPDRGRPARYNEEHLRRLELIKQLKAQHLPLHEIREILERTTPERLEKILEEPEPSPLLEAAPRNGAAEYIAQVLARRSSLEQLKQEGAAPKAAASQPARAVPEAAPPAPSPAALPPSRVAAPSDTWRRLTLAPGIELHHILSSDAHFNELVARLIEAAGHVLDSDPEKDVE